MAGVYNPCFAVRVVGFIELTSVREVVSWAVMKTALWSECY